MPAVMRTPRIRLVITCLIAILIIGGVISVTLLTKQGEAVRVELPADEDIDQIKATVEDPRAPKEQVVPEFTLPKEYVAVVMSGMRPAEKARAELYNAWHGVFQGIAHLTIRTRDGKTIAIVLYDVGNSNCGFTVDGVQSFRSGKHKPIFVSGPQVAYVPESWLICEVLRGIYREQTTHKKSDRLLRDIEKLRRSIGALPPEGG